MTSSAVACVDDGATSVTTGCDVYGEDICVATVDDGVASVTADVVGKDIDDVGAASFDLV